MLQRLVDIKTDAAAAFEKESKRLLVRLDDDVVSLALADVASGAWEAAEVLKIAADDAVEENFVSRLKQSSSLACYKGLPTLVLVETARAMAIPMVLTADAPLFFEAQFGDGRETLLEDAVNETVLFVFATPAWQQALIASLWPEAKVCNTLALLTRQALMHTKNEGTCLYLHLGKSYAEAVLVQQGRFMIARNIDYSSDHDLLYHLLNIARQFKIHPASLTLQVQGMVTEDGTTYSLLRQYFAPVSFAGNITPIRHKAFWQVPPHFFTGLMYEV